MPTSTLAPFALQNDHSHSPTRRGCFPRPGRPLQVHFSEFTIDGNALENVQEGVLAIGGATHVREPSTGRIIGAKRLSDNETFITREDVRDNETVTGA